MSVLTSLREPWRADVSIHRNRTTHWPLSNTGPTDARIELLRSAQTWPQMHALTCFKGTVCSKYTPLSLSCAAIKALVGTPQRGPSAAGGKYRSGVSYLTQGQLRHTMLHFHTASGKRGKKGVKMTSSVPGPTATVMPSWSPLITVKCRQKTLLIAAESAPSQRRDSLSLPFSLSLFFFCSFSLSYLHDNSH